MGTNQNSSEFIDVRYKDYIIYSKLAKEIGYPIRLDLLNQEFNLMDSTRKLPDLLSNYNNYESNGITEVRQDRLLQMNNLNDNVELTLSKLINYNRKYNPEIKLNLSGSRLDYFNFDLFRLSSGVYRVLISSNDKINSKLLYYEKGFDCLIEDENYDMSINDDILYVKHKFDENKLVFIKSIYLINQYEV
jgi:hypothetical protein